MKIAREPDPRTILNLADIQGNVLNAYGKRGFPMGRVILLNVRDQKAGRDFILEFHSQITTAIRWQSEKEYTAEPGDVVLERPSVTLNLSFTFWGLFALGVPVRTLSRLPPEFVSGMRSRAALLGDKVNDPQLKGWDKVWSHESENNSDQSVHIMVLLNADMDEATGKPVAALDELTRQIIDYCKAQGYSDGSDGKPVRDKIAVLNGHGDEHSEYQELSAICARDESGIYRPTPYEHFGFFDGISDPVFHGQFPDKFEFERCNGNGKLNAKGEWQPLATGEFLLGYPDEAKELPPAAAPHSFSNNGTFMAYRKLEEKVGEFNRYLDDATPEFALIFKIDKQDEARELLMAKFSGRWSDGVPLVAAPTFEDWQAFNAQYPPPSAMDEPEKRDRLSLARYRKLSQYVYAGDPDGIACPSSSHTRRVHPRDALGPEMPVNGRPAKSGTNLVNRRRILRRGLPYDVDGKKGIVMLICCASLERQFEFVQQQWLNYGMDNNAGNDTCPMLGARENPKYHALAPEDKSNPQASGLKFVIPADPAKGHPPYICSNLPQFVETKGGAYFFIPSMTSLRMIALGTIDTT